MTDTTRGGAPQRAGHLSAETLADLQEGLLDARETLAAQGHLLGCPRCAGLRDRLAGLPGLLAGAAEIGAVPADVARRLDDAVAAEARAGLPTPDAPVTAARTGTPQSAASKPPVGMRVLQVAAVLVLLLAGTGIGVTAFRGGDGGSSSTTAGDAGGGEAAESPAGSGGFPVTASGQNWAPDTVAPAVPRLLAGSFPTAPQEYRADAGAAPESSDDRQLLSADLGRLAEGPPLADCVTALAGGPASPLAVDLASWQGNPAAVIVLPTPDDPTTVDTWVVGPGCAQADAQVLHFARVARP